ncbi:MAG: HNH endonuclease family protein [Ilumatobacteraceae bacterium]
MSDHRRSPAHTMHFPRRLIIVVTALVGSLSLASVVAPGADAARRPKPPPTTTAPTTTVPTTTTPPSSSTSTSTTSTSTSTTSTSTTSTTLPPGTVAGTAAELLGQLATLAEVGTGYSRTLFTHWVDADGDGCNTRYEVLIAESLTVPVVVAPCTISNTTWFSAYDGITEYLPADVDIDHVVALKEAWDSGAWNWSSTRRRAFANDLDDARSLIAVTDNVNAAKGDMDPAQWMPPRTASHCQYLFDWVAVKVRWGMSVDPAERTAITTRLAACPATVLVVQVA